MVKIGITENVFISGLEPMKGDKGASLIFSFKEATGAGKLSAYDLLNAAEHVDEVGSSDVRIFPVTPPDSSFNLTQEKAVERIVSNINAHRGLMEHFTQAYMTKAEGVIMPFEGMGITSENLDSKIQNKEILAAIFDFMVKQFVTKMKPFLNAESGLFRLLLIRQSKDNPYATFRTRYLNDNPIWESMDVPKEATKVAFSSYEINNGLDNDLKVEKSSADAKKGNSGGTTAPTKSAAALFGEE